VADVGEYRYMEASFSVDWHHVTLLDRAVWEVRRFCTLAPEPRATKLVEGQWAPRVRIAGGYLEQVIRKRAHPAREPLLWQNAYFGRGRRTIRLRGGFISVNSPLLHTGHLIEEIRKLAYVPEGVVKAYRENVWKEAKAGKKR
jgi:hypothetical protein